MRRSVVAVGFVGIIGLLAGCGSASTPAAGSSTTSTTASSSVVSSAPASSSVASSTPSSSSAAATGTASTDLGGTPTDPGQLIAKIVSGYQAVTSTTGSLQVSSDTITEDGTFQGSYSGGKPTALSMSITMAVQGQSIPLDVVLVDGQIYLHSDELLGELKIAKPWLQLSADSANPQVAQLGTQLQGLLANLGTDQYSMMADSVVAAAELGTEDRNGQQEDHYQMLVDTSKAIAQMSAAVPSDASAAVASAAAAAGSVPVDIWLDPQGRLVESKTTQTVSGSTITTTYRITGFDVPVTVTAPDQSDVSTG